MSTKIKKILNKLTEEIQKRIDFISEGTEFKTKIDNIRINEIIANIDADEDTGRDYISYYKIIQIEDNIYIIDYDSDEDKSMERDSEFIKEHYAPLELDNIEEMVKEFEFMPLMLVE